MKKYRVFGIVWDIDGSGITGFDLPSEVVIEVEDDFNPTDEITNYLSDDYGWCINSCSYEEIKR